MIDNLQTILLDSHPYIGHYCHAYELIREKPVEKQKKITISVMNIEWDYSYYQPWSDNEWLVDEIIAIQEEVLMAQNEDITMQ